MPPKIRLVKAMVFPVLLYSCKICTIKKTDHQRIDTFELWCQRRLLRVPWTSRRSNQSVLKEISPGYSLEGLMLKLKLQCFGHLMPRANSLERPWRWGRLKPGGEGDDRGRDCWMHHWLNVHLFEQAPRDGERTRKTGMLGLQRFRHYWATEQQQIFIDCKIHPFFFLAFILSFLFYFLFSFFPSFFHSTNI